MRPLLFLHIKLLVNGIKKAFSSPTRILGILFFIFVQFSWLSRVIFRGGAFDPTDFGKFQKLTLPSTSVIEAIVFGAFSLFTLLFVMSLFNTRAAFRSADVDVLFPTPVDPRTVLVVRVLRDIWISLVMPLVFAILLWRPAKFGWASLFSNVPNPAVANTVFQVGLVAYFLSAIAWVWIGHAASLSFSKPDLRTDRLRALASWAMALGYLALLASLYFRLRDSEMPATLVQAAHWLDVKAAFFLATAATALTMSPLTNNWAMGLIGGLGLVGAIAVAFTVARRNTAWLYEQAALRTAVTETMVKLSKSGDMMAMAVNRAQSGKIRAGRSGFLHRVTVRGPWAMVWKEALVMKRTNRWATVLLALVSVSMSFVAVRIPDRSRPIDVPGVFLLVMQSMLVLGPAMGFAQAGFIESLRRIDLLKPIPFTSNTIVLFEVVCKAAGSLLSVTIGLLAALVMKPSLWQFVLGGLILFPALSIALSSVSLLLVLLLPDVEDPTQRGFRGLATMLGMLAVSGPPVGIFALLLAVKVPIAIAAVLTAGAFLGITWLATLLAGRTYENFNPAD